MDDTPADVLAFMRAVGALHRSLLDVGEALAAAAGLSHARHLCLQQIADGPLTVAEIAARLDLARQGVLRLTDLLVGEGLAVHGHDPRDGRARLLTLTRAGRQALADVARAHERWVVDTAQDLAPLDVPGITERLLAVRDVVTSARAEDPPDP